MRAHTWMVVVCMCIWGGEGSARRDYEPYVFAAVPLHAPVPVLRVLSPARPRPSHVQRTPYTRPYPDHGAYAESRPYVDIRPYSDSSSDSGTSPYSYTSSYSDSSSYESRLHGGPRPYSETRPYSGAHSYEARPYSSGRPYVETIELYEESPGESREEGAVLYARPSAAGGYFYRPPARGLPQRTAVSHNDHPMLIKIHKQRIIKS